MAFTYTTSGYAHGEEQHQLTSLLEALAKNPEAASWHSSTKVGEWFEVMVDGKPIGRVRFRAFAAEEITLEYILDPGVTEEQMSDAVSKLLRGLP